MAQVQIEASNYKEQLEQQKDYSEIKQERDQLKTELNQKESQIIVKIINELKLGLNNETNLEQVLEKVKELIINKTPDTSQETEVILRQGQEIAEKDEEIKKLRKQNKENYVPSEKIKQNARQTFKALGIENSVYQKRLAEISSCQELENFRQEVIKKEVDKISEQRNEVEKLNIVLWVLFISSLLATVLLIIKMNKSRLSIQNKKLGKK